MSEKLDIITIDGPSGVGKSTIARMLAAKLGYTYLDTGAMYRAIAYAARQRGIPATDEKAVEKLVNAIELTMEPADDPADDVRVFVDGSEVTPFLRTPETGMLASAISAVPAVRQHLTKLQQQIGAAGKIVVEGRDTGTVVFPQARWKFYLDAEARERARRRARQLQEQGVEVSESDILAQIRERDRQDQQRTIAPLRAADDAIRIDSTHMSAKQVVNTMLSSIRG
jgi:cytidylate kinase